MFPIIRGNYHRSHHFISGRADVESAFEKKSIKDITRKFFISVGFTCVFLFLKPILQKRSCFERN